MTDYSLWEVILDGDSPIPTRVIDGVVQPVAPTIGKQRPQKLISQLEIFGESLSQEDINMKLLKSLPTEWRTHILIWKNKRDLEEQSLDDLFNNLKICDNEVKSSSTSPTTQNISFVSSQNTASTNESVSVVACVSAASTKVLVFALPNVDTLSDAYDGIGSYDWSFQADEEPTNYALVAFTSSSSLSFDNEARDNALVDLRKKFEKAEQERDEFKLKLENFQTSSKNPSQLLASQIIDKTGLGYDNQVFNSTVFDSDELISSTSDMSMPSGPVYDRYKSGEGYHAVPPPYTRTFMPPKPNLGFYDAPTVNETVPTAFNVKPSTTRPNKDLSPSNSPSVPIIEDWVSDSKDNSKGEHMPTQKAPSFVHSSNHIKTPRPSVKPVEHPIPSKNLKKDIPKTRDHIHSWNRKACFVCKSLTHLIKDCDYYEKKMVQKPVQNHA
nr:hypothetical protein [Tanacetum cinerariifolium]